MGQKHNAHGPELIKIHYPFHRYTVRAFA